jgi:hypothetical protein
LCQLPPAKDLTHSHACSRQAIPISNPNVPLQAQRNGSPARPAPRRLYRLEPGETAQE